MLGLLFVRCFIFYHYLRSRYKTGTTVKNDKKLFIETYGCQMNVADSEVIGSILKVQGRLELNRYDNELVLKPFAMMPGSMEKRKDTAEGMTRVDREAYARYMKDPIHPTLLGYTEWWTPKFLELFERLTPGV